MILRSSEGSTRGAVAVEFALVMPVLLLILLGIVDFGRIMFVKNALTYATAQAARVASVAHTGNAVIGATETATVANQAINAANSMGVSGMSGSGGPVSVDTTSAISFSLCPPDTPTPGNTTPHTAMVTASVPFKWITPAQWFQHSDSVSATTTWLCVETNR